jgi:transglutaminase superfamily protein
MSRRNPARSTRVIAADTGHALILLNVRTGRVRALPGAAGTEWRARYGGPALVSVKAAAASWGTSETPAALPALAVPSVTWAVRALAAVTIVLTARSTGTRGRAFARMVRLASAAARPRRAAALHEAQAALQAVRWTAQFVPTRMACLEESVAAAVALALAGRRADWRHGIACDPVRMHAWIEACGQAVGEPASTSGYTPLIRIPLPPKEQEAPHE